MMLTSELHPANYGMSIALLLTGCMVQSIGVVLELKPKVAMMSAEAFVKYASRHYNKEFGKFKVYFDITLVTLAVVPVPVCFRNSTLRKHFLLDCRLHYWNVVPTFVRQSRN